MARNGFAHYSCFGNLGCSVNADEFLDQIDRAIHLGAKTRYQDFPLFTLFDGESESAPRIR